MPLKAPYKPSKLGGGRKKVLYRNSRGRTEEALVLGEGTDPGTLRLRLVSRRPKVVLDNVSRATSVKDTDAYLWRR